MIELIKQCWVCGERLWFNLYITAVGDGWIVLNCKSNTLMEISLIFNSNKQKLWEYYYVEPMRYQRL